jgi:hypothetical protein
MVSFLILCFHAQVDRLNIFRTVFTASDGLQSLKPSLQGEPGSSHHIPPSNDLSKGLQKKRSAFTMSESPM